MIKSVDDPAICYRGLVDGKPVVNTICSLNHNYWWYKYIVTDLCDKSMTIRYIGSLLQPHNLRCVNENDTWYVIKEDQYMDFQHPSNRENTQNTETLGVFLRYMGEGFSPPV